MYFETSGLVIKSTKTMTNDIFLTVFTQKAGKMDVVANGAKSSKSQLAACAKPFVFANFVMNTKGSSPRLISSDIHESNFRITDHLDTLAYGSYFLELCNLTTHSNVVDLEHYRLIVEMIHMLSKIEMDLELMRLSYLIKLCVITGHKPNLTSNCSSCGLEHNGSLFSIKEGGLICLECSQESNDYYKLNPQWISLIQYLMIKDIRVIMRTKINEKYTRKLVPLFEDFLKYHQGINTIKSTDFLNSIK